MTLTNSEVPHKHQANFDDKFDDFGMTNLKIYQWELVGYNGIPCFEHQLEDDHFNMLSLLLETCYVLCLQNLALEYVLVLHVLNNELHVSQTSPIVIPQS